MITIEPITYGNIHYDTGIGYAVVCCILAIDKEKTIEVKQLRIANEN